MPTAETVTIAPETVQTLVVVEAKLTGKPEDAVALTVKGAAPRTRFESVPNMMVWLPCVTLKLRLTGVAAAKLEFPAWVAWMVQVPSAMNMTAVPDTVQTDCVVEVKVTGSPEVAVALTVIGDELNG